MNRSPAPLERLESRVLFAVLPSGQTVTGSLTNGGSTVSYDLPLTAGQTTVIAVGETALAGYDPQVVLLDPDGDTVASASGEVGATLVHTPARGGTYTLRVGDAGGNDGGGFRLTAFYPGPSQADDDNAGPIDSGRRRSSTIAPGDLDVWTAPAFPGQRLAAVITENSPGSTLDPAMLVIGPDGSVVADLRGEAGARFDGLTVTQRGTYYFVVHEDGADDSGTYGFSVVRAPGEQYAGDPDTVPLLSGVSRDGDLPGGDLDLWSVYIDADTAVSATLTARSGSLLDPEISLIGPDGKVIALDSGTTTATLNATTTVGGTHYFLARDLEGDDGGLFAFRYDLSRGNGAGNGLNPLVLNATAGDDRLSVAADGDVLTVRNSGATPSTDVYYAPGLLRVEIYAGAGNDLIDVSRTAINTYVFGDIGDDTLYGGAGNDTLTGGAGRNRLFGGDGNDRLNGSGGRDFLYGEGNDDRLYGEGGNDYLDGGGNVDRLFGGAGDDFLTGAGSNDKLYGEAGNDTLEGGRGSDLLVGGIGNDVFFARDRAIDTLDGGAGNDLADRDDDDILTSIEGTP
jgi:Ca2+-binding RTX toxin-like protein